MSTMTAVAMAVKTARKKNLQLKCLMWKIFFERILKSKRNPEDIIHS